MWKSENGNLIHTTDNSRIRFRVRINAIQLAQLKEWSQQYDTNMSYLIDDGLARMFDDESMVIEGSTRTKGNIEVGLTLDVELVEKMNRLIESNEKMKMTMIIKCCIPYIKPEQAKKDNYRYRVES